MPARKNKSPKTKRVTSTKVPKNIDPWVIPGLPSAREKAKDWDQKRRGDSETFEL
jgi:hypothetical protein